MRYDHHPFHGAADLQAMIDLVSARPAQRVTAYPSALDLQEIAGAGEGQATIRLWEAQGAPLAGFTLLDDGFLAFEVSPGAALDDLAGQMIEWALAASASAPPEELTTGCEEVDTQRMAFLERLGFVAQPVRTLHFLRSLDEAIPAPCLPEGFSIRSIHGEGEAAAWVDLHRAAHETENMTVDYRLAMMRTPGYDRSLDLVAVSPEGRLAAYVVCHFSEDENRLRGKQVGYTDPLATHPQFQGKGLARALLLAGFACLKERGMAFAEVHTWGENTAMIRTAEAVGYRRVSSTIFFERAL